MTNLLWPGFWRFPMESHQTFPPSFLSSLAPPPIIVPWKVWPARLQGTGHLNRVRYITDGQGSIVPGNPYPAGPVVEEREGIAYKLPETASGIHSSQDLPKVWKERSRLLVDGQSDGCRAEEVGHVIELLSNAHS